jgi:hypothetical protein
MKERLFEEMYSAIAQEGLKLAHRRDGGELCFFYNHIIPLARTFEECGMFGVSSDEYLNYALESHEKFDERELTWFIVG